MRAAVVRDFNEDLSIETVEDPSCPENGVVLEVAACGVCRSDFHGWVGSHPKVTSGSILGHEYCGTVVEAGAQAKHKIGDKLIAPFILGCGDCLACQTGHSNTCESAIVPGFGAPGAYAEFVAVPFDHNLVHLPETMPDALAAGLGCRVTTAWHALTDRANVRAGEWVAVHGTGGIGLSALLLAKMLGARVVVVDVVQEKLDHALTLGADATVNAATEDVPDAIREITKGGAQVSLEALGIAQTTNASVECLATLGRHVHVGMPAGDGIMEVNMRAIYSKQLAFFGTRGMPAWKYPSLLEMIERGDVDLTPMLDREVTLSGASAELRSMKGPTRPGTAVITDFSK
ncbi:MULTISPECIES: zinc-binding dehydrogenase [unclassified Ruegeria]|uniref:zinc-binding dehydrogenase n=1 Tax=unclassified Ruegeria TaxID=2625375 RepID=UPI001490F553|nr:MULTISPECIES: zinc-binding dehydrogenase [unclassified Ruegeria]NOD36444.1 alcohol dehydrogenase catalytic domain-containing protein [Ruegeria sp. HKCCD7296]NOD49690.1 alcohol dehydrogenase catalytic domain-containing protein [Ruegeria sp. HKCCD5849]NOD53956.1 alcohol dehydrogenase catalytic domain-containing protein [Ruegeria sp. HKCCD5851]NOD68901.1 alcohol dehydrogenase catalytic domain-containing protein [Ruegeria sp. HKCCD7303]NOE34547.1 alcohol dehydrogenase catalytic domain-containin